QNAERFRVERPVQIPDREAVRGWLQVRMRRTRHPQWIDIRNQMAALAPRLDQTVYAGLFHRIRADHGSRSLSRLPTQGLRRDSQVAENLIVKSILAFQQRLHARQEQAGFGAL